MKRREVLPLIPLTLAGMTTHVMNALSQSAPPEDYVVKYSFSSPEPLSIMYTEKVREMLTWIRNTQSNNMLETAHMIARTKMKGGTCWCMWDMGHGHNIDIRSPERNGLPEIFTDGYDPQKAKDGDLFLANINLRDIVKWMGAMQRNLNMNMFGENGFTRQKVRAKYFEDATDVVK